MHFSTLLLALAPALATAVSDAGIPGYTIVPMDFEIEVSPGKIAILNGTVQEVIAQAQAINPDFALQEVKFCNNFGGAGVDYIREGTRYLKRLSGQANMRAGPRVCSRVSCSYDSAIYLCNDNNGAKSVTWDGVANSAYHITEICPWGYMDGYTWTSGQNFEKSLWNTLVKEERC
ncbi:hypothetical protein QBC39DRAFT_287346 [Podospora conica]|nr:hypothetical protein QBC39DRAFT_287346 [Schizothecium conicum]